jgi:hypothetical protein
MVCTAFGYPGVIKGANWTCELLTFVFDKLVQSGIDLRHYEINLQSDNATKESKNNSVARMLSFYVSRGLIRCARMHYCVSGHSHEDIDQYFSLLGSYLQTQSELHDPEQFAESLRRYLSNTSVRPLERMREVVQVDQVRDWLSSRNPKYFARFSFQSFFREKKQVYFVSPPFRGKPRTTHLHIHCHGNFLKGMGGPGAPHAFAFDRYGDVKGPGLSKPKLDARHFIGLNLNVFDFVFFVEFSLACFQCFLSPGGTVREESINRTFWRRRGITLPHDNDVILRTEALLCCHHLF